MPWHKFNGPQHKGQSAKAHSQSQGTLMHTDKDKVFVLCFLFCFVLFCLPLIRHPSAIIHRRQPSPSTISIISIVIIIIIPITFTSIIVSMIISCLLSIAALKSIGCAFISAFSLFTGSLNHTTTRLTFNLQNVAQISKVKAPIIIAKNAARSWGFSYHREGRAHKAPPLSSGVIISACVGKLLTTS